jgi:hypothetical protein
MLTPRWTVNIDGVQLSTTAYFSASTAIVATGFQVGVQLYMLCSPTR